MARVFLFDLDGTICDSKPGIVRSLREALARVGRPVDASADLDWCVGPPLQESLAEILGTSDPALNQAALDHYRNRYERLGLYENELYPGMAESLETLASRARLFVATSKPTVFARKIIGHFGLSGRFQDVYGSGLDGSLRDKAELIAHILKTEALDPAEVIMVGDREHDIKGARSNGIPSIGVLWGYGSKAALLEAGADATADIPAALIYFLAPSGSIAP